METMLNPMGRIGPATFRNAAIILILIGACFSLLPLALPALALWSFCSLLLLYPWAVIWVKRLHDAGKSGKMFLVVLVAWLITGGIVSYFVSARFAPPMPTPTPGSPVDIWGLMTTRMQAVALPGTMASVAISLGFALFINEELKSEPGENDHGAAPKR